MRINAVDPGFTATDLNYHSGTQTVEEGVRVIVRLAQIGQGGPTGGFFDAAGPVARSSCSGVHRATDVGTFARYSRCCEGSKRTVRRRMSSVVLGERLLLRPFSFRYIAGARPAVLAERLAG